MTPKTLTFTQEELEFLLNRFRDYHVVHVEGSRDYPFLPQRYHDLEQNLHNQICRALGKPDAH